METGHKTQGDGSHITGDINIDIKNIHNLLDNHITAINEIHVCYLQDEFFLNMTFRQVFC